MLSNVRVPTTAQIRALEAAWIKTANETTGTNWAQVLMEVAGRGAAFAALTMWQEQPGHVAIICGRGNNGGDGLVVARYLTLWGIPVSCFVLSTGGGGSTSVNEKSGGGAHAKAGAGANPKAGTGAGTSAKAAADASDKAGADARDKTGADARDKAGADASDKTGARTMSSQEAETNLKLLEKTGAQIFYLQEGGGSDGDDPEIDAALSAILNDSTVVVDAIFGTGLKRPVVGLEKNVIEAVNRSFKSVLSVDMPSGLNSDTGQIMGSCMRANKTVTFGHLKPGQLQYPGASQTGDLSIVDIGLPDFSLLDSGAEESPRIYLTTCGAVQGVLPGRPTNSHKGTFGHLLTIGGSLGMTGASVLSGFSALRTGAGLSYVATAKSLIANLPVEELVYRGLSETSARTISHEALKEVSALMDTISALVLGPGLSQNADTVSFVLDLLDLINKPCVIDADGLNAISQNPDLLKKAPGQFILTPHPKELSRLTGKSVNELQASRINECLAAAKMFNSVVVLKGAYSVVASPQGEVYINPTGNSGMSTAGSGDVLSGMIGGLLAQGLSPLDAAVAGVYLHGKAGDIAAENIGHAGLVAGDITAAIPLALTAVAHGEASHLEELLTHSVPGI